MARITVSKEEVQGFPPVPEGLYDVQLRGFKPKKAKKGGSTNLNPDVRIINHPTLNDRRIWVSMNTNAPFMWHEICHAFGCPLEDDGDGNVSIPGEFSGDVMIDPSSSVYSGPLLNQQGKLYVVQVQRDSRLQNDVRHYVCRVSGCNEKHSDNLIKA